MKIFADYDDWTTQITIQDWEIIWKKIFYDESKKNIQLSKSDMYLSDEKNFKHFSYLINIETKKFTVDMLEKEFEKYVEKSSSESQGWRLVARYSDDIYINWEKQSFLIWQSGNIFFTLNLIYFSKSADINFLKNFWYVWKDVNILPRSFYSLDFIKTSLQKHSFWILTIDNEYTKLVLIKWWKYFATYELNQWISLLKSFLAQEWASQMYIEAFDKNCIFSSAWEKVFEEVVDFFSSQINSWAKQYTKWENVFLISELTASSYFLEKILKNLNFGFVLPFARSISFPKLVWKWNWLEIDMICALNYILPTLKH